MTAIEQIQADLDAISDIQVERCASRLGPIKEGEVTLFLITDPAIQRLWTLAEDYAHQALKLGCQGHYEIAGGPEHDLLHSRMHYLSALSEIARDIAWLEMKREANTEQAWDAPTIGLRANFTLVAPPESQAHPGMPPNMSMVVGPAMPLPVAKMLAAALQKMTSIPGVEIESVRAMEDDDDDPPPATKPHRKRSTPRKPQ